jgi:TRAP-type C4-dicarboxylate transport system permease small subunit
MRFTNGLVRTKDAHFRVLITVSVVSLSVICVTMLLQIFLRRVLRSPLEWAEDLSVFLFIWITFLGAAILFEKRLMISVDTLTSLLPAPVQRVVEAVSDSIILVAVAYLLRLAVQFLVRQKSMGHNLGGALRMPSWVIMIPVIICLASMILSSLVSLLNKLQRRGQAA